MAWRFQFSFIGMHSTGPKILRCVLGDGSKKNFFVGQLSQKINWKVTWNNLYKITTNQLKIYKINMIFVCKISSTARLITPKCS